MTTQSWSTVIDHTSDAGYRAWGLELNTKLAAAGLVQTADTGQVDWTTVTRPAANTLNAYEIWRFNDSLQGTAPIYFRLNFGTANGATRPNLQLIVGTGSNGSGTITGTALTGTLGCVTNGAWPASTVTAYQSFLCVAEGFVGLVYKTNAVAANYCGSGFMICRSCDTDGAFTADGAIVINSNSGAGVASLVRNQSLRFAASAAAFTGSATHMPIFIPGAESSSLVGSDNQAYLAWMITPQVVPALGIAAAYTTEVAEGTTAAATLVGATSHTYLSVGRQLGTNWAANTASLHTQLMLWE